MPKMTLLNGVYTWTGLKDSHHKPNAHCYYKSYWGKTDHEVEDGICYSSSCEAMAKHPDLDPIEALDLEIKKMEKKLKNGHNFFKED